MKKSIRIITPEIKITDIEKNIDVFVIDEEKCENNFFIGIDWIENVHLVQNERLEIKQQIQNLQNLNKDMNFLRKSRDKINYEYQINFNEYIEVVNFDILVDH